MLKISHYFLIIFFAFAFSKTPLAAELIMLEQDGCVWCERWHKEIGEIYPKTEEAIIAPLRIINIHHKLPSDLKGLTLEPFTPTFVLMNDGIEIGRLRGYTGNEFFWFLLNEMFEKMKKIDLVNKS